MKTYTSKSNARRAALKQLGEGKFEITGSGKAWSFKPAKSSKPAKKKPAAKTAKPKPKGKAKGDKAPSKTTAAATERSAKQDLPMLHKSAVTNPVQAAWELFDNLRADADKRGEKLRRKDVIAAAQKMGIAFYTARTQYQSWKTANKF